jgi:hypothetical protein
MPLAPPPQPLPPHPPRQPLVQSPRLLLRRPAHRVRGGVARVLPGACRPHKRLAPLARSLLVSPAQSLRARASPGPRPRPDPPSQLRPLPHPPRRRRLGPAPGGFSAPLVATPQTVCCLARLAAGRRLGTIHSAHLAPRAPLPRLRPPPHADVVPRAASAPQARAPGRALRAGVAFTAPMAPPRPYPARSRRRPRAGGPPARRARRFWVRLQAAPSRSRPRKRARNNTSRARGATYLCAQFSRPNEPLLRLHRRHLLPFVVDNAGCLGQCYFNTQGGDGFISTC